MTTRLNVVDTTGIKFMNFGNNSFSLGKDKCIGFSKNIRMSCASVWDDCFGKVHKLFTNLFFSFKERIDFRKQQHQCSGANSPVHFVSISKFFRGLKTHKSTDMFFKPIKAFRFCVDTLEKTFISFIWPIFWFIGLNAKRTFSVNKTSQVSKILFNGNCFFSSAFDVFKNIFGYVMRLMSHFFKFQLNRLLSFFVGFFNKLNEQFSVSSLFNQIRRNLFGKRKSFTLRKTPLINWPIIGIAFVFASAICPTAKVFCEELHNLEIYRRNNNKSAIFDTRFVGFAQVKATIAVQISGSVSKQVFHSNILPNITHLSHQSNSKSTPTEVTDADIMSVVMGLMQGDARMVTGMIDPSTGFNTAGVLPAFLGFASADLYDDFQDLDSFKTLEKYSKASNLYNGELGSTPHVRWCFSTNGYVTGGTYSNFIAGEEAYGVTGLAGGASKVIIKQLGSSGVSDALDQRSSVGWKSNFACRVLNDNWVAKLTCTHS